MTIKDDIALLREAFAAYTPPYSEAIDRIEAALTPPADRQAALDDMDKLSWQESDGEWNFATREECESFFRAHYKTIRAALSLPAVPVIKGLEEAINIIDGWGNQDWDVRLNPKLYTILKAARAYVAMMKGDV